LDAATARFLREGYGTTSMEAIAADAGVSKRTLYARFPDKAAVLQTAISRLIGTWLGGFDAALDHPMLEDALTAAAQRMLAATLTPEALALYRLLVAEAGRIPDLPRLLAESGAGTGIARIATLLANAGVAEPGFAAEQFQRLIITGPQHRALGFGPPMDAPALERWCRRCVALFLRGVLGSPMPIA
jgi:AcrR family transcriptional regulator